MTTESLTNGVVPSSIDQQGQISELTSTNSKTERNKTELLKEA
jgi:hypothetical protein